ncbi:hypothetical protein [Bifidobacterium vespertilionis]|uniref:Uncharacterized protein n=1 Tax=Bifidobacterium vespertilionis TaxID=2562524 RepID=A0A5J5E0K3_9BIFI|nr:hypothetical protein [Bifidobacterium vespertilionis]KAA8822661.1 hypothetical protein EMO90_01400 [Bifidobacterium vespertilionis]KAA8824054.1 hypothetical protein EM848_02635 [Bifidobacterium vespertilionis]
MTKRSLILILRIVGFACVTPVAMVWWGPVFNMLIHQPGGWPSIPVVLAYGTGLVVWLASFALTVNDIHPSDPGRMIAGAIRIVAEWLLALIALPIAFVCLLLALNILSGGTMGLSVKDLDVLIVAMLVMVLLGQV